MVMITKKGRYRFVVISPLLGLAFKFPILHPLKAFRLAWRLVQQKDYKYLWIMITWPINSPDIRGYGDLMFGAIWVNWSEFMFFWKTRHPFLQPTYFSFFGLLNIQKAGAPCVIKEKVLCDALYDIAGETIFDDPHHLTSPGNYCFDNGKFRIIDYGSKMTYRMILESGEKVMAFFSKPPQ